MPEVNRALRRRLIRFTLHDDVGRAILPGNFARGLNRTHNSA
jgi:hypothetical protein